MQLSFIVVLALAQARVIMAENPPGPWLRWCLDGGFDLPPGQSCGPQQQSFCCIPNETDDFNVEKGECWYPSGTGVDGTICPQAARAHCCTT
ncbi:hypothetical protein BUE80_DR012020 [Diplocarpon rosae]|nr:hypothetical protein BUE80_DR012020 [Diplocarpon rosae]